MFTLFPKYLNVGSRGPAVLWLQQLLYALDFCADCLPCDGEYDTVTAKNVEMLQRLLGVTPDGNFGPETRAALKAHMKIDVEAIHFAATFYIAPNGPGVHPAMPEGDHVNSSGE